MSGIEPITAVLLTAGSRIVQAQAQNKAAQARARAVEENAARAREDAAFQESELRRRNTKILGRQRALFAKSGVKLEGTPLLVQSETATEGELDALTIRRRADGRLGRSLNDARALRLRGSNALNRQVFNVGNTLLSSSPPSNSNFPRFG